MPWNERCTLSEYWIHNRQWQCMKIYFPISLLCFFYVFRECFCVSTTFKVIRSHPSLSTLAESPSTRPTDVDDIHCLLLCVRMSEQKINKSFFHTKFGIFWNSERLTRISLSIAIELTWNIEYRRSSYVFTSEISVLSYFTEFSLRLAYTTKLANVFGTCLISQQ